LIAIDTNILVYADRSDLPRHKEAVAALRGLAEGDEAWALPVFCTAEFVRVVSHARIFDSPTPPQDALASVDALLESPSCRLLMPGARYWPLFEQAIRDSAASGNLVFDAQIVAVCLEHGARTILTEDRDFSRFPGVTIRRLTP
jgi:toxin-antitoxin system PIN domain toxin